MGTTTSELSLADGKRPAVLWLTGFGLGYLRPAPGTWGSVGAALVWWLAAAHLPLVWQIALALAYLAVSWPLCALVCRDLELDDAPQIVADEVAGMWIALVFVPPIWWAVLLAFVVFRVLDITKPLAIGWLDREVGGGAGVMLDDVLAGLVTGIVIGAPVYLLGHV